VTDSPRDLLPPEFGWAAGLERATYATSPPAATETVVCRGGSTGTQRDFTVRHIPLDSNHGPAERMPAPPEMLSQDRDQRRAGPARPAMGTTAPRWSGGEVFAS